MLQSLVSTFCSSREPSLTPPFPLVVLAIPRSPCIAFILLYSTLCTSQFCFTSVHSSSYSCAFIECLLCSRSRVPCNIYVHN
jgi:hypothetical protein